MKLHEMQDMRTHSGHRQSDDVSLLNQANEYDQYFMHDCPNNHAKREWNDFMDTMLDDEKQYLADLDDAELLYIIDSGQDLKIEYNLT